MQEQEINKLEDLIPYHDSLKELWEREERFHPVLRLLASLYKENVDQLIGQHRTGAVAEQFELAERAAVARITATLFNLPAAIKAAVDELEKRKSYLEKMKEGG
jgi:hypothetical protein